MFIASKRYLIIPGEKGREPVSIPKGFMGEIPDWAGGTAYFKALAADGKIVLSEAPKKSRKKADKPVKEPEPPAGNAVEPENGGAE